MGNNVQTKALAAELPDKNVLFAFALSAGHRENDRVVSIDLKKITIGQLAGAASNKQLIEQIFSGTKYKVVYEPNMEDYLLCHAAFVMPAAFACYKTDGDLKKLKKGDTAYLERLIDANIEGYRAIRNAGHAILPKADVDFESEKYRRTCLRFFKLMCATSLGKLCASDHAMNAIDEMSALNRDIKQFFDAERRGVPRVAGARSGNREVFAMKYIGMPFGMWTLFAPSFRKQLTAVFGYDADAARDITKKAKPKYQGRSSMTLPEFEKGDRFKMNLVNCAMIGAFILSMPERPDVERLTVITQTSMMTKPMKWFCRRSGKSKFTEKDIAGMKATAALRAADRNPYSWNMEFYEYPGRQRLRGTVHQMRHLRADEKAGAVRFNPCPVPP